MSADKAEDKTNKVGMDNKDNTSSTSSLLDPKCIFCKILSNKIPSSQVYEDEVCRVIMDIHPIRPGHVLIIPRQHYQNIMDMPPDVAMHMVKLAHQLTAALTSSNTDASTNNDASSIPSQSSSFECHGTNLLWNNGRAAWQTVLHAHLHVIPRRQGDSFGFLWGMFRHLLSLLGVLPPANRSELDRIAGIFHHALTKHIKSS